MKYSIGQLVSYKGFGSEAMILAITVNSYVILLSSGITSEVAIESLERVTTLVEFVEEVTESHITPYKGRTIDYSKTVMIYKNLTNGLWSIKQGGEVVGHTNCFLLRTIEFKVYEATRQRVIAERKKYVHAYVIGYLDPKNPLDLEVLELDKRIVYNPYKSGSFMFVTNEYLTPIKNDGSMYYIHGGNGLGHLHLVKYSS